MNTPKKSQGSLEALFDALADSAIEASDAEIREEYEAAGESPAEAAQKTRALLIGAVKKQRQRKLEEARAARQRSLKILENARHRIPATAAARRELFFGVVQSPQAAALELQFRDYKDMTDDDIESWLEQFGALGLLDHSPEEKE